MVVALWGTAMETRETWARDLMAKADDSRGAALLAVQQVGRAHASPTSQETVSWHHRRYS